MLAIVESIKHWRHYLEGSRHPIQVFSDHKDLETFMTTKVLNRRQARWAELLANYDFVLIHTPGVKNPADGPSRRPDYNQDIPVPSASLIPPQALRLLPSTTTSAVANALFSSLVGVHANPPVESGLRERILTSLLSDVVAQQHRDDSVNSANSVNSHWKWEDGILLYKNLVYLPENCRVDVIKEHHDAPLAGHQGMD